MKQLAQSCPRIAVPRRLTKTEAAQQQLEAAIANLFLGNWACAITLAGAAEYMLPDIESKLDLFKFGKTKLAPRFGMTEKEFISFANEQRDWLKHPQVDREEHIFLSQDDAIIMILRAYTRLHAVVDNKSEHMVIFENWLEQNYAEFFEIRGPNHQEKSLS